MHLGPIEIETRITLSGLLSLMLACFAAVGGLYALKGQHEIDQIRMSAIEKRQDLDEAFIQRIADTLNNTSRLQGILQQRLDDAESYHEHSK